MTSDLQLIQVIGDRWKCDQSEPIMCAGLLCILVMLTWINWICICFTSFRSIIIWLEFTLMLRMTIDIYTRDDSGFVCFSFLLLSGFNEKTSGCSMILHWHPFQSYWPIDRQVASLFPFCCYYFVFSLIGGLKHYAPLLSSKKRRPLLQVVDISCYPFQPLT